MRSYFFLLVGFLFGLSQASAQTTGQEDRLYGEVIYVPAYSQVFSYPNRSELLAATLAVHNVDPETTITLKAVAYHNSDGELVRNILEEPTELAPLQSRTVLIPINDTTGGVGANFVVVWASATPATSPIAESILTGPAGSPGPSFTSRGKAVRQFHELQ